MASVNRLEERQSAQPRWVRSPSTRMLSGHSGVEEWEREEVDRHVCQRIRLRRLMLGLTQGDLARKLRITVQQAHKYECGVTRISAARLLQFAQVLDVGVGFFFEGRGQKCASRDEERRFLELARSFQRLGNDQQRLTILKVAQILAQTGD